MTKNVKEIVLVRSFSLMKNILYAFVLLNLIIFGEADVISPVQVVRRIFLRKMKKGS